MLREFGVALSELPLIVNVLQRSYNVVAIVVGKVVGASEIQAT